MQQSGKNGCMQNTFSHSKWLRWRCRRLQAALHACMHWHKQRRVRVHVRVLVGVCNKMPAGNTAPSTISKSFLCASYLFYCNSARLMNEWNINAAIITKANHFEKIYYCNYLCAHLQHFASDSNFITNKYNISWMCAYKNNKSVKY